MGEIEDIQTPDEVRVRVNEQGEAWVSLDDLITSTEFAKEVLEFDANEDIKNSEPDEREELEFAKEISVFIMSDMIESLKELKAQTENEKPPT